MEEKEKEKLEYVLHLLKFLKACGPNYYEFNIDENIKSIEFNIGNKVQEFYALIPIDQESFYHTQEFCIDSKGKKSLMWYLGNNEWCDENGTTNDIKFWLKKVL